MGYGACIQRNIDSLEKGACEKEFSALRKCFAKAVIFEKFDKVVLYSFVQKKTHFLYLRSGERHQTQIAPSKRQQSTLATSMWLRNHEYAWS